MVESKPIGRANVWYISPILSGLDVGQEDREMLDATPYFIGRAEEGTLWWQMQKKDSPIPPRIPALPSDPP